MSFRAFVFRKKVLIPFTIVLIAGGWYVYSSRRAKAIVYDTAAVERRDLAQTVEVTGEIKPGARIELAFKQNGTIAGIQAHVGDSVKPGDVLAELKADDVNFAVQSASAALSIAEANLAARIAGETKQAIRVAEAAVEQAQAALNKAIADLTSAKRTTQDGVNAAAISLATARNNLTNQDAIVTQNVQNAYDSALTQLRTAMGPLNTGLSDGDQISGVDNTAANQSYINVLGFLDAGSMSRAKISYQMAKDAKVAAEASLNTLSSKSPPTDISAAALKLQNAITLVQAFLTDVQHVLASSLTNSSFTASDLAAKKTIIDTDRTAVSSQSTAVLTVQQTIKNAELAKTQTIQSLQDSYQGANTAYDTAVTNADVQIRSAETAVTIQRAALDSAKATLDLKRSPAREADLAPLRAAVEQAHVALDKSKNDLKNIQITASATGTISEVLPDIGEQVTMNSTVIKMIGTEGYEIEAKVPEADVSKVGVGQQALITLDAYGDDVKFPGSVLAKDPADTRVQDAIYYKIRVHIDPSGKEVKPGMTANVTITTGVVEKALSIPLRSVRTKTETGEKTVRVLASGQPSERTVTLGLKGDEGRVEVRSGLNEGDLVILGETTGKK